jgi:D-glycero-alpha-D-manno-heptose 1-phosphate guanylyltransferase
MQAIILAGGLGTRLRSVVQDVPKPMAPIHNKPFLAYLLDYLKLQGITRVILSVHYLRECIQAYFKSAYQGIAIDYAIEETALGTGGAILQAMKLIDAAQSVFVLNGDTFLKLDYRTMVLQHHSQMSMTLRKVTDCSRYGMVQTEKGVVTAFAEQGSAAFGLINAGVYLIQPTLFQDVTLPVHFSFEKDFLFPHIQSIKPQAFVVEDYFIDIGIPEDYARAIKEFACSAK